MKRKSIALICIMVITLQIAFATTLVSAEIDTAELTEKSNEINVSLQEKYFKDEVSGGFEGLGDDEGNNYPSGDDNVYARGNSMACAAFYNRYLRSGNAECDTWGTEEAFPAVSGLDSNNMIERSSNVFYTTDQGIALEFLSDGYDKSQNQEMLSKLENWYSSLTSFESNGTAGYFGYDTDSNDAYNAYWRAVDGEGIKLNNGDDAYKYCFTNASLWAIIGMLKFGMVVEGLTIDNEEQYSVTSMERALKVIEFVEDYSFYNGSGFMEYPEAKDITPENQVYYFNTQVLAVLAYTRLYEATDEQVYLDKANMMVEYIITKNFISTGETGGAVSYISVTTGEQSDVKLGYDNALYAYALIQLYLATNEQDYTHLRRAEEIVNFMNSELYQESDDGEILGYVEILIDDEIPDDYEIRLWSTNALMMYINEEIMWHERPWFIKYLWWIIIGAIVIVGIIVVVVLVRRRKNIGRKLPKMVKGLIEE